MGVLKNPGGILSRRIAAGVAQPGGHAQQLHQPGGAVSLDQVALGVHHLRIAETREVLVHAVHQVDEAALAKEHHGGGGDGLGLAVEAEDGIPLDQAALFCVRHTGLGIEHFFAMAADKDVHAGAFVVFHGSGEDIGDLVMQGHGDASFVQERCFSHYTAFALIAQPSIFVI